jgi:hypothetical protein
MGNLEMVFERIFDASFFKVTLSTPSRCVALKALESSLLQKNKCKSFYSPTWVAWVTATYLETL